jgi:hypothetical protein
MIYILAIYFAFTLGVGALTLLVTPWQGIALFIAAPLAFFAATGMRGSLYGTLPQKLFGLIAGSLLTALAVIIVIWAGVEIPFWTSRLQGSTWILIGSAISFLSATKEDALSKKKITLRLPYTKKMVSPMTTIRAELMTAVQEYLKNVVVPVLYDDPAQGLDQKGTCTLIGVDQDIYLLSAQHVFKDLHAQRLKIPANVHGPDLIELWPFEIIESGNSDDDIILLKLNALASDMARSGWQIVDRDQCRPPNQDALFVIGGYPSALLKQSGELLGGTLVISYVERIGGVPHGAKEPVSQDIDLFFEYKAEGTNMLGLVVQTPRLNGVSGGAIWELDNPRKNSIWAPKTALHLVGIQTGAFHFSYARGKSWTLISEKLTVASA